MDEAATNDENIIQDYSELNLYDYIQIVEGIPANILDEVIPTVEFLVSTASAYDCPQEEQTSYPYYEDYYPADNTFDGCASENDSDEDNEYEKESIAVSPTHSDNQNDETQLSDRLDIDRILEDELKRLNLSRETRRRNRRKYNLDKNALFLSGLVEKTNAIQLSGVNDKAFQTELDHVLSNSIFSECFGALSRIADVIPETNDDLDDYRLAASMYVNMKLLETNKDLNWKVDSLGKCLKRALSELCLLRLALQNTVSDLQTEIDLLRKNTLSTIRRIIQDDIKRREKIQEQWNEIQSFIRRKNRRITELTEQLNGADLEVGFLLASHKDRIESAAFAERRFFRASERIEDLEMELKKKRCALCGTNNNREVSDQEKKEQEEIQKRREAKRKEFEDTNKQQIANAERYGKVIHNLVSTYQDPKNSNLPWHDNSTDKQQVNGQSVSVGSNRVSHPPTIQTEYKPGFVPYEVYQLTRFRCEEVEKEARKQERMNEILSRDLTDCKSTMTKLKTDNVNLKEENTKILEELNKLKADFKHLQHKNGKLNLALTPPDSIASDKSKEDFLPKPPTPPELAVRSVKNLPILTEQTNKRKFIDNTERNSTSRIAVSKNPSNTQKFEDRIYFSPSQRINRRSVSPEPKRPALAPPSLMPPQRCAPELSYQREIAYRIEQAPPPIRDNRSFYDDTPPPSFRSFSPPNIQRRDVSPPPAQFTVGESWNRRPQIRPSTSWQAQSRGAQQMRSILCRPLYSLDPRPSLRPPQLSPNPPDSRPLNRLPPWHGTPMLRPQMRPTTSWINNASAFSRR